jgi:hydrogenase/urease accessory protein HupE
MKLRAGLLFVLAAFAWAMPTSAHELRPAYLEMTEKTADTFSVFWKVPALGDKRLSLYVGLPETCRTEGEPSRTIEGAAFMERFTARCEGGLKGKTITVEGLRATLTDAMARIQYRNGTTEIARLTPEAPVLQVAGAQSAMDVAWTYFRLGVEHILTGIDHLLFVFALILLIGNRWMLVKTITAFTLAHSITLAGAALGYVSLPQKPVEATIALSIAFVASELLRAKAGDWRLPGTAPWVFAFGFGLLHGFGFAGALKEIGLPQTDVPIALLMFNVGVEAGQLIFVAAVLALIAFGRAVIALPAAPLRTTAAYGVGITSMVWVLDRLAQLGT